MIEENTKRMAPMRTAIHLLVVDVAIFIPLGIVAGLEPF